MSQQEFASDKDREDRLHEFFKKNHESAFTIKALHTKIEEVFEDPGEKEYLTESLSRILNEMERKKILLSKPYEGELYFYLNPNLPKIQQKEENIEDKLQIFFRENRDSSFTVRALLAKLENISMELEERAYLEKKLPKVLVEMEKKEILESRFYGEKYYSLKINPVEPLQSTFNKEVPIARKNEVPYWTREPIKLNKQGATQVSGKSLSQFYRLNSFQRSVNYNNLKIGWWMFLLGLVIGLISTFYYGLSLMLIITIIVVAISILAEGYIRSIYNKAAQSYSPPKYGIIALVFNIVGYAVLRNFPLYYGFTWYNLIAAPLILVALISAGTGFIKEKGPPVMALANYFLGCVLIVGSLFPLVYLVIYFITFLLFH